MLWRQNDSAFYFSLGNSWHHPNKINDKFRLAVGDNSKIRINAFGDFFVQFNIKGGIFRIFWIRHNAKLKVKYGLCAFNECKLQGNNYRNFNECIFGQPRYFYRFTGGKYRIKIGSISLIYFREIVHVLKKNACFHNVSILGTARF